MMQLTIEAARPHELNEVLTLLKSVSLSEVGVAEEFGHYIVARDDESVVGVCGVELHGEDGLLRNLVVDSLHRNEGIGARLVRRAEELAQQMGLRRLYLLTLDREGFFSRLGFARCTRSAAPSLIRESWEFSVGYPASAVLMQKTVV
jgi:amino-acid N-acetyltransferase